MSFTKYLLVLSFLFLTGNTVCQEKINLVSGQEIPSVCTGQTITMKHDETRPFLYVASMEAGLKIYQFGPEPGLVKTIGPRELSGLDVMNLTVSGNYLFLALGNHFSKKESAGLAVIDITEPEKASVCSFWSDRNLRGGSAIVEVSGNYAYLGAMGNGLIIFDISDKKKLVKVSQFIPSPDFPDKKFDKRKINARGMAISGNYVFLCYDAGGLRIIDISDKSKPQEIAKYSNPVMNGKPRAYNNIIADDTIAFVAVDYCGLEVINLKDTFRPVMLKWWNPWNCEKSAMQWFKSDGHANELAYDKENKRLFVSTGKSELHVFSVADPSLPEVIATYGDTVNKQATWGVSFYKGKIFLSYICAIIPFSGTWTGVKVLAVED